jgi:hypothetical protein
MSKLPACENRLPDTERLLCFPLFISRFFNNLKASPFGISSAFLMPCPPESRSVFAHFPGGQFASIDWSFLPDIGTPGRRRRHQMNALKFSGPSRRILLGSDNHHLISAVSSTLIKAGFHVDTANDYDHLEVFWMRTRHDIVLFEVSRPDSIESATESALRIKRQDARQFIAYLADANLQMSGLTGDAIFSRNLHTLPQALRAALGEEV